MIIGINAAAAVKQPRTGVEEYCYQLIKHLTMLLESEEHRFLLYIPNGDSNNPNLHSNDSNNYFDFSLPENFEVQKLKWPLPMWTQVRLAAHLAFNQPDELFIPVHILPFSHPKNSVVTIHGLEYEYFPHMYPFWFRQYLRWGTKYAVKHARKIIAASENTKRDLVKLYGADESKVGVVYHGVQVQSSKLKVQKDNSDLKIDNPYLLYIGRVELKKNILGILEAYKILKEKYKIPHELVLAGSPGYGYDKIKFKAQGLKFKVMETGYVSREEKSCLLEGADAFLFPTFYEGFGLPILEAQAVGVPVVASNNSSVPEVTNESALLVDSGSPEQIAQAVYKIIDDQITRDKLIELGYENVKRFNWERCARETLNILCA